jgi:hypothetical protein
MQENFDGVAKALVQMGATKTGVDIPKFGRDLKVIVKKIGTIEPELLIHTTAQGEICSYPNVCVRTSLMMRAYTL